MTPAPYIPTGDQPAVSSNSGSADDGKPPFPFPRVQDYSIPARERKRLQVKLVTEYQSNPAGWLYAAKKLWKQTDPALLEEARQWIISAEENRDHE